MQIIESILTNNPCYKAGKKIVVKGLMLHSVGCPQPSAQVFVQKWNSPNQTRACVHAFIDGNSGNVYQTLPWDHRAWHGGGSSNNGYIGVEMCEPACIKYTGGASFQCSDKEGALEVVKRTYTAAVELYAFLCKEYGLNPLEDGVIVSHKEGHQRGIASGHGDPEHLWEGTGSGYTMNGFRSDVSVKLQQGNPHTELQKKGDEKQPESLSHKVQAGSIVSLTSAAVYESGKEIPGWVQKEKWIVKSVTGERVVLGKNVSGTNEINSPVNIRYLITDPEDRNVAETVRTTPSPQPCQTDLEVSVNGVELVAKYEGCRLDAYRCPAGVWTIGYGHTAGVKPGDKIGSQEEAKKLLKEDLKKYSGYVKTSIKNGEISFEINQNQFDALTSFCYNCGYGNLKKLVAGRNSVQIAEKLPEYNKGGGKVLPGLVRRREEERALFLKELS